MKICYGRILLVANVDFCRLAQTLVVWSTSREGSICAAGDEPASDLIKLDRALSVQFHCKFSNATSLILCSARSVLTSV